MLCITFRTVVGWGEFVPVVRLIRHAVNRTSRDVATSVADAMVLLDIFREREVGYLSTRPMVRAWVDALLESTVDEVETEYVQRDLRPASHAQISQAVAMAGGSFIGSALLDDGLPDGVPEKLATLVNAAPSQVLRESLTDLFLRRSFSADLFTLGGLAGTTTVASRPCHSPHSLLINDSSTSNFACGRTAHPTSSQPSINWLGISDRRRTVGRSECDGPTAATPPSPSLWACAPGA
ncbi:MAG: methyltransferase regulatory domain-containing protein [Candidatus Microthrix sp.]|nr:methyltransferase regulatory domain-containing protein [Candidatus Microthrix sp.]MBK7321872.1 methyltransferase regulatory domain-containing protein [Candidatus Microthrix sp.]